MHDQLSGTVNGAQVTFHLSSDPAGRQFQVSVDASGKTTTNIFDRHQNTTLLPDLDSAAYTEMVHFALARPQTTWIVIPKQNGLLVPAQYTPQPDLHATFHGQPVDAHHTSVIVSEQNGISVELYYTSEGALLEADIPEQNFYVIRDDFKLQSRPHYTPPRGSAPPANPQGQPNPQQPPGPDAAPGPCSRQNKEAPVQPSQRYIRSGLCFCGIRRDQVGHQPQRARNRLPQRPGDFLSIAEVTRANGQRKRPRRRVPAQRLRHRQQRRRFQPMRVG